jgi:hypothetical protein
MDPGSNTPIIILKSTETDKAIPIWIGLLEATSIASALQNIKFDRPMTHDLFKNFLDHTHFSVSRIEVCDLRDNTYFARIYFEAESNEKSFSMDARPSDAIAIALRFGAPIYVDEQVMAKSVIEDEDQKGEAVDKSEEGKKWAEYLENLSPEDFGKYKV